MSQTNTPAFYVAIQARSMSAKDAYFKLKDHSQKEFDALSQHNSQRLKQQADTQHCRGCTACRLRWTRSCPAGRPRRSRSGESGTGAHEVVAGDKPQDVEKLNIDTACAVGCWLGENKCRTEEDVVMPGARCGCRMNVGEVGKCKQVRLAHDFPFHTLCFGQINRAKLEVCAVVLPAFFGFDNTTRQHTYREA